MCIIKNKSCTIFSLSSLCFRKSFTNGRPCLCSVFTNKTTKRGIYNKALETSELEIQNDSNNRILDFESLYRREIDNVLKHNNKHIKCILSTDNNRLNSLANYYFKQNGKMLRPTIVLLMSKATSIIGDYDKLDGNFVDCSNNIESLCYRPKDDYLTYSHEGINKIKIKVYKDKTYILPKQQRLAHITELIHVASLFHDDVIDNATLRRKEKSVNLEYNNKLSILGGDFLLSRASVALARLNNVRCVELLATVISNLVEGELIQLNDTHNIDNDHNMMEAYIEKIYLKTASLFANSCQATAILNTKVCNKELESIAYDFGKNFGLAFQIVDDILDITGDQDKTGKQTDLDFENGILTLPIIMATKESTEHKKEIVEMIKRKCTQKDDKQKIKDIIFNKTMAIENCMKLAVEHTLLAKQSLKNLPDSGSRKCLENICDALIHRKV